ncbi:unnamed protein product [Ilex paraguariensis]|uniref:Peptidase A1 domain-containing protein n=1 Tax=Ilex paraguariensis TaxID=185542 RepID=A0ABC8RAD8_9AQUA
MAVSFKFLFVFSTLSLFFLIQLPISFVEASNGGFSVDLIHRSSPLSPFYDPSHTRLDHLNDAFRRSVARTALFNPTSKSEGSIQSQLTATAGAYLMKVSIGTPPVETIGIADTGSDLTWTQCSPCTGCYKQEAPFFDPKTSSTYRNLSCHSEACEAVGTSSCRNNNCQYRMSYGDKSYSIGEIAAETFTFGSTSGQAISIPKVVFGCGHNNGGNFKDTASGIIGLSGSTLSIVNQLKKSVGGKFSYCLVPLDSNRNVTSKINFGSKAMVSGSGVVSTPMITKAPEYFYYLTLDSITVGNKSLAYKTSVTSKEVAAVEAEGGNIIIDSGTTLTFLPSDFYEDLESALKQAISADTTPDQQGLLSLCYKSEGDIDLPTITFHFTEADLELQASSTFIKVQDDVVCLAMIPNDELAIFGNLSQMNFLIGYDLVNKKISFKPTDCTKQ